MEFKKLINERRSIRAFDETKKITSEQLQQLVNAAIQAPSWKNSETARYYAIQDEQLRLSFEENCLPEFNVNSSKNAALIVTTFNSDISGFDSEGKPVNEAGNGWGYYDLGLSNAYFILKAKDMGLDTLIMGIRNESAIRKLLNIPPSETIVSVIAVGYRAAEPTLKERKTLDEVLTLI